MSFGTAQFNLAKTLFNWQEGHRSFPRSEEVGEKPPVVLILEEALAADHNCRDSGSVGDMNLLASMTQQIEQKLQFFQHEFEKLPPHQKRIVLKRR